MWYCLSCARLKLRLRRRIGLTCTNFLFAFEGLGERILKEEKEMREMKRRLLAIEADLQALYRESGEESEVSV